MNTMNNPPMPRRILARLQDVQRDKWERILESMLSRLELTPEQLSRAEKAYTRIAEHIANELDMPQNEVHIVPQGSMRTRTTVRPRGNSNFDLDIVVKLTGHNEQRLTYKALFDAVGGALQKLPESAGDVTPKNRCWRVQMPREDFYFDVTPAIPDEQRLTGAALKVPDNRRKGWVPSNPEEFAKAVELVAAKRFDFQQQRAQQFVEARKQVDPLPTQPVPLDDILRRVIQVMKLHRDNFYWNATEEEKERQPISVIIVTLAMRAFDDLVTNRNHQMRSNIEVALEVIENMPRFIEKKNGMFRVSNPALPSENFAERWNEFNSKRADEFYRWHGALIRSVELLFEGDETPDNKEKLRSAFGQTGVDAFEEARRKEGFLGGLLATAPGMPRTNPTGPVPSGKSNTLA